MKKNILLFGLTMTILIFSYGCKSKRPEKVATQFLTFFAHGNLEEAKALTTGDALNTIETIESLSSTGTITLTKQDIVIENMKCETEDDLATCTYITDGIEGSIDLTKVDKEWKVSRFPKENSDRNNSSLENNRNITNNQPLLNLKVVKASNSYSMGIVVFCSIGIELFNFSESFIDRFWLQAQLFDKNGYPLSEKETIQFDYLLEDSKTNEQAVWFDVDINNVKEIRLNVDDFVVEGEKQDFQPMYVNIIENQFGIRVSFY